MKKRALITGITGFAGSHLAEFLLENYPNIEIFGISRWRSPKDNILKILDKLTLFECDLTDFNSVLETLKSSKPDYIFHLAAQSFVPTSWRMPVYTFNANVIAQINLFEAVRILGLDPTIQIACSSEEYGLVLESEIPIKETNPLRPLSPYAVSKVAQDYMGYQYFQSYGMKIVRTRGFNHTGPRRGEVFVVSNFAKQLALIKLGYAPPVIKVGNLDAVRDFTDVRDMVRAYYLAVSRGKPGEVYNVASGKGYSIREVLDRLIRISGLDVKVERDPKRERPSDVMRLVGDYSKFHKDTGWKPEIDFDTTLKDTFNYWVEKLQVVVKKR